jgi:hypothetical protein
LENPGIEGWILLKWIFNKWDEGMDWIDLVQDRVRGPDLLNAVMNLQVA